MANRTSATHHNTTTTSTSTSLTTTAATTKSLSQSKTKAKTKTPLLHKHQQSLRPRHHFVPRAATTRSGGRRGSSGSREARPAQASVAAGNALGGGCHTVSFGSVASSATATLLRSTTAACVTLLLLSTTCSLCAGSLCEPHSWWDPVKDKCIACTVCEGDMIPLRPCQLHRDTVCGSIYDLKIDWVVLTKTEPNWKERRKADEAEFAFEQQLTQEQLQQLQDESVPLDWQTAALFLAVLACLLFFIVAACILVHHMRQWRRMERRLDQDVEELSTKLMAKLAEVQSREGGTFFIGNADALRMPATPFQPQHVLLPEKSDKQHERRTKAGAQSGNVYIEGHGSKC